MHFTFWTVAPVICSRGLNVLDYSFWSITIVRLWEISAYARMLCVFCSFFSSVHLDNESLGINHPDLFQTLLLSEPLLLHGHGDQLSDPHRCLGVTQRGRNQCRREEYLIWYRTHVLFWDDLWRWPMAYSSALSVLHIPPLHLGRQLCGRTFCSWWCGGRPRAQLLPLKPFLRSDTEQH